MSAAHDNPPAFPCEWDFIGSNRAAANGMTLRDYFAAKALQGMLAGAMADGSEIGPDDYALMAMAAYKIADAMLEARK